MDFATVSDPHVRAALWSTCAALAVTLALLAGVLFILLLSAIGMDKGPVTGTEEIGPKAVGILLFGPYLVAAELAAFLLLAGVVGASHLRRREYQHEMKGRS